MEVDEEAPDSKQNNLKNIEESKQNDIQAKDDEAKSEGEKNSQPEESKTKDPLKMDPEEQELLARQGTLVT